MKVCTNETYVLHTSINFCIFMKHYVRSKINDQTSRSQQCIPNSSINEWSNSIFQDNLLKLLIINVMSITNTAVTGLLLKYRINSLFLIHSAVHLWPFTSTLHFTFHQDQDPLITGGFLWSFYVLHKLDSSSSDTESDIQPQSLVGTVKNFTSK